MRNSQQKSKSEVICFWRGVEGIWTPDEDFADPCLTTWPRRHVYSISLYLSGRWDSNPRPSPWQGDVLPLYYARIRFTSTESAETQNRTVDTAIFSRVLYQLSYLGDIQLLSVRNFTLGEGDCQARLIFLYESCEIFFSWSILLLNSAICKHQEDRL